MEYLNIKRSVKLLEVINICIFWKMLEYVAFINYGESDDT
jgi:hypothetical protein